MLCKEFATLEVKKLCSDSLSNFSRDAVPACSSGLQFCSAGAHGAFVPCTGLEHLYITRPKQTPLSQTFLMLTMQYELHGIADTRDQVAMPLKVLRAGSMYHEDTL